MYRRGMRWQFLLPFGVLVRSTAMPSSSMQSDSSSEDTSLSHQIMDKIGSWLAPKGEEGNIWSTLDRVREVVEEDMKMTADERRSFLVNALILKAMHDRQQLEVDEEAEASFSNLAKEDTGRVLTAARFARFAAGSYGTMGNLGGFLSMLKQEGLEVHEETSDDDTSVEQLYISKHTGIPKEDVIQVQPNTAIDTRAYFVALDHETKSVVVSIRGTFSPSDAAVDLACSPSEFMGGSAHPGMAASAHLVWSASKASVEKLLREYKDYKLVFTGHSLGAGAAILSKLMMDDNRAVMEAAVADDMSDENPKPPMLDAGRDVHVECYAFAPPPVYHSDDATEIEDMYSFVIGYDFVPTASLGSVYSLFRAIRKIHELDLNDTARLRFILDSRVRLLRKEESAADHSPSGLDSDEAAEKASKVLQAGASLGAEADDIAYQAKEEQHADNDSSWSFTSIDREITRFTDILGEKAPDTIGDVMDVVDDIQGFLGASPFMVALAERLTNGQGPSTDEMYEMVKECEKAGRKPNDSVLEQKLAAGDLIIPGNVYKLDHHPSASSGRVGRVLAKDIQRIRINANMLTHHSLDVYEPAMMAAAEYYSNVPKSDRKNNDETDDEDGEATEVNSELDGSDVSPSEL